MKECDLVMKGGITSGVVYPFAISKVSDRYRLRNIGGTSAGAIAAAMAAAAEYRRQEGDGKAGFKEIKTLAETLADNLKSMFQPSPELAPLFELLLTKSKQNLWHWQRLCLCNSAVAGPVVAL